jgi:hypothetical protein
MAGSGSEGWTDVLHRSQQQQQEQQRRVVSEEPRPQADADATRLVAGSSIRVPSGDEPQAAEHSLGRRSVNSETLLGMVSKEFPETIGDPDSSSKPVSQECGTLSTDSDKAASPSVSESQEDEESDDSTKPKKNRSTLRKGKWTVRISYTVFS